MECAFVSGYAYTVESYWRCVLPARALRVPALVATKNLRGTPDIAWIHQPLTSWALSLARRVKAGGGKVVVDFSEDCWERDSLGEGLSVYTRQMLAAAESTVELADVVVVAHEALASIFPGARVEIVPPALIMLPEFGAPTPGVIAWWSDGRQKAGFEAAAPKIAQAIEDIDGSLWHIQFPHMKALHVPLSRQLVVAAGSIDSVDSAINHFQRYLGQAEIAVECYPPVPYRDCVSDVGLLRHAACGVPTITTRRDAPPGSLSAPYTEWPQLIRQLHEEPDRRRALSASAREWAESRVGFDRYHEILDSL